VYVKVHADRLAPLVWGPPLLQCYLLEICHIVPLSFIFTSVLTEVTVLPTELSFTAVPVDHCPDAFGLVIKMLNKKKIVYSGDTRPCELLIDAGMQTLVSKYNGAHGITRLTHGVGQGVDLLIHEATFESEMTDDAIEKMHSTTAEAIGVATLYVSSMMRSTSDIIGCNV
jgi:ribonuclease Z